MTTLRYTPQLHSNAPSEALAAQERYRWPAERLMALSPGASSTHEALAALLLQGDAALILAALMAIRAMIPSERGALMRSLDPGSHERLRQAMRDVQRGVPPGAAAPIAPTDGRGAAPGRYKPLLDLIARFESNSAGGYDAMNQGGSNGGHTVNGYSGPARPKLGKPLTQMTVQEVMDRQDPRKYPAGGPNDQGIHAAGRYQIIGSTLKSLVAEGVVRPTDRFDEATQDKLGAALIERRRGQGERGLRQEWIGLKNANRAELGAAMQSAGLGG
jgi:hypothetical protein